MLYIHVQECSFPMPYKSPKLFSSIFLPQDERGSFAIFRMASCPPSPLPIVLIRPAEKLQPGGASLLTWPPSLSLVRSLSPPAVRSSHPACFFANLLQHRVLFARFSRSEKAPAAEDENDDGDGDGGKSRRRRRRGRGKKHQREGRGGGGRRREAEEEKERKRKQQQEQERDCMAGNRRRNQRINTLYTYANCQLSSFSTTRATRM